jgi:transposase
MVRKWPDGGPPKGCKRSFIDALFQRGWSGDDSVHLNSEVDTMAEDISDLKARLVAGFERGGRRRRFDAQAKRELVEACLRPNVSVAGMALEHGLNANLLRRWISDHVREQSGGAGTQALEAASPAFVPVVQIGGAQTVVPGAGQRPVRLEAARTSPCLPSPSRLGVPLISDC